MEWKSTQSVSLRVGLGRVEGMDLILLIGICNFVLILVNMWWILTVVRGSSSAIANLLADLDRNLAEIVERILGEVPAGAMADINPLQAMIMQVIQSKIDSPIAEVSVIEKDASGKFKKSE